MKHLIKKYSPKILLPIFRKARRLFDKELSNSSILTNPVMNLNGIEIGGPSRIFDRRIPVYAHCGNLDFINFSTNTMWEKNLSKRTTYFKNKTGRQYVAEATNLEFLDDNSYDFLISSNCLEHVANPVKALQEWARVTRKNIILIVPNKKNNFDRKRPYTSFEHVLSDFKHNTQENDMTHLDEILELHDLRLDVEAGTREAFEKRSHLNPENRCLHHHVFSRGLVQQMCEFLEIQILHFEETKADLIFLISVAKHSD